MERLYIMILINDLGLLCMMQTSLSSSKTKCSKLWKENLLDYPKRTSARC